MRSLAGVAALMGVGVVASLAFSAGSITPAAAQSASCNGGNVTGFNRTAPAGGAANINQNGTFAAGDVLTATATGGVLSVAVDINPGANVLIFFNGTGGTGSFTFPTGGTFTINGALNAAIGGAGASLAFTCVGGTAGTSGGSAGLTPENMGAIVDGVSNTQQTIEDTAVNGLVDGGANADPSGGSASTQTQALERKLDDLRKRRETLLLERDRQETLAEEATENFYWAAEDRPTERPLDIDVFRGKEASLGVSGANLALILERDNPDRAEQVAAYLDRQLAQVRESEARIAEIDSELEVIEREITDTRLELGEDPFNDDIELRPFRAAAHVDRFERDFLDIVRHFDEPENNTFRPLEFNRALDRKTVAWVRASYTEFDQDDATRQEGDTAAVALGIHRDVWDDIRLGVFATTTWSDLSSPVNALDVDTRGYSVGLYGRYLVDGLSLSARARYGWSDSDISVGGATGTYDSRVFNVNVAASGREDMNPFVWVQHTTALSSTWTTRDSYTTSAGATIGSNDTWSGQVSLGPTIGTTIENAGFVNVLEPAVGFSASYVFSNRDSQSGQVAVSDDDYLSGAVSPQLSMVFDGGASLDLQTSYFGIGASLSGWSVGGTFSLPLN